MQPRYRTYSNDDQQDLRYRLGESNRGRSYLDLDQPPLFNGSLSSPSTASSSTDSHVAEFWSQYRSSEPFQRGRFHDDRGRHNSRRPAGSRFSRDGGRGRPRPSDGNRRSYRSRSRRRPSSPRGHFGDSGGNNVFSRLGRRSLSPHRSNSSLSDHNSMIDDLRMECDEKDKKIEALERDLETIEEARNVLDIQVIQLKEKCENDMASCTKNCETRIKQNSEQIETLEATYDEKYKQYEAECAHNLKHLETIKSLETLLESQKHMHNRYLIKMGQEMKRLETEKETISSRLSEMLHVQSMTNDLSKDLSALQMQLSKERNELENERNQKNEAIQRVAKISQQKIELEKVIVSNECEINQGKRRLISLEAELNETINKQSERIRKVEKSHKALIHHKKSLVQKDASRAKSFNKLKSDLDIAYAVNVTSRRELAQLKAEKTVLKTELDGRKKYEHNEKHQTKLLNSDISLLRSENVKLKGSIKSFELKLASPVKNEIPLSEADLRSKCEEITRKYDHSKKEIAGWYSRYSDYKRKYEGIQVDKYCKAVQTSVVMSDDSMVCSSSDDGENDAFAANLMPFLMDLKARRDSLHALVDEVLNDISQ